MSKQMYGVVLWSDRAQHTAIVWCEDQGDLAFLGPDAQSAPVDDLLDEGDLILFDLQETKTRQRRVCNPRCVGRGVAPGFAEGLLSAVETTPKQQAVPPEGAEILLFPDRQAVLAQRTA